MSQPPSHASNSPNGRSRVEAPRRGDAYEGTSIFESRDAYHSEPASSITTFAPARVSAYADMPPPAPEPTMQTSYCGARDAGRGARTAEETCGISIPVFS